MNDKVTIRLRVNGVWREINVNPNERLLDVLRNRLSLKSVKAGCLRGECGLCTVILNRRLIKSCLVLAVEADGADIVTLEGIAEPGKPTPVQRAFIEKFGFQCGFCTPAFILATHWLCENMPQAGVDDVKKILNSIICRCTGYEQILEAVMQALQFCRRYSK